MAAPAGVPLASVFRFDAVAPLVDSTDPTIRFWARRDLLGERAASVRSLWTSPLARSLIRRQRPGGSWRYSEGRAHIRSRSQYDQLETYRNLRVLVEKFGLDREHPALHAASEYLLAAQSTEGDIRGIYGAQYSPNYTAGILELLVRAGYTRDERVDRAFTWLREIRQDDGGWAIPLRTRGMNFRRLDGPTIEPDRTKPFSHLVTGVVLRAYAAHPRYRYGAAARHASTLLASRLFRRDAYPDRSGPEYWTRFSFPFWFTDLISALDSLSRMRWTSSDPAIAHALAWLAERQRPDGTFELRMVRMEDKHLPEWLALAVCRVVRRLAPTDSGGHGDAWSPRLTPTDDCVPKTLTGPTT
jgi:squalene-hopene cyclase-like protein